MINWLRLIRYKNLLIVFLTQLLVWYCLIYDSISYSGVQLLLNFSNFILLSISTILISAAGYIINDYFDIKIDIINRPEKVILEKTIPLRTAIIAHAVLNVLALLLAGIVAAQVQHYAWLLFQMGCIILLWFYSTHFKRQYIIGNVTIALLTALTIVVLVLYEPAMYAFVQQPLIISYPCNPSIINPLWMCAGFCFFAFMLTWMREIVKDMEDFKGDAEEGCVTMPIKMGLQFSARWAIALGIATILALVFADLYFINNVAFLGFYIIAFIILPLIWWCFYLLKNNTLQHYRSASKWLKIIMLAGITLLIIYSFFYFRLPCQN